MAESTLSVNLDSLRSSVARLYRSDRSYTSANSDEQADIDEAIANGLRRFYVAHRWSFLEQTGSITTTAPYSTGTVVYDHTGGTYERLVTLTTGTWPSWAAEGTLLLNGSQYEVDTRYSDTLITLPAGDNPGADVASTTYSLERQHYDLPDSYGGIVGPVTFPATEGKGPITIVGEEVIRNLRQSSSTPSSHPRKAAVRPKPLENSAAAGQRFEMLLWPGPDAAYVLSFRYVVLLDDLTTMASFPGGGMLYSEAARLACLAAAESIHEPGAPRLGYEDRYKEALAAAIAYDNHANAPEDLGYMGDSSDDRFGVMTSHTDRHYVHGINYVSYNGTVYYY